MKEKIIEIIKQQNNKATFKNISQRLGIENSILEKLLLELKLEGSILQIENKYSIFPENMFVGKISLSKSVNKVIFHNSKIYPLEANSIDSVILNDTVSFTINDKGKAVITSIIDRELHDVTCVVKISGKRKKLECFHKGINITLPDKDLENLKEGDVIIVNIDINDLEDNSCHPTFKGIIGNISEPNMDEIAIALNYGFDNYYSEEYLEELNKIPTSVSEKDCINRLDLRDLDFVTIDGIDAKDMDDTVYATKIENGYRVYVSISDVSNYIKFGTEIFKRAYEKGNSYYANNIVFHMLHCIISNGICSLNPNVDRLTKTVIMDIDYNGKIVSSNIAKTVIRSRIKMNYDDVDKFLIADEIIDSYKPYEEVLKNLYEVTKILEKKSKNINGKIDFPSDEVIKTYDDLGNVLSVKPMLETPSRKLIEYLMVTANEIVASFIYWWDMPSIYRIHDIPDLKKVNETLRIINESDVSIKFKSISSVKNPKTIQAILHKLSNIDEYPILANILLQDMQRAEYNTQNIGHYALGLEFYTHFTSPIRRLCDLLIHMILDILIENNEAINTIDFNKLESYLQEASKQASRMERQADAGENESSRLAIIKSMQKDIGNEFEATVIEVGIDNIKVKVNGIDAYVKYKYLSNNFNYDNNSGKYYDKYNNKILKLGSKVIVKLDSINLNTRTIHLEILGIIDSKILTNKRQINLSTSSHDDVISAS